MKKKYVKALLLAMSISMAIPALPTMAASVDTSTDNTSTEPSTDTAPDTETSFEPLERINEYFSEYPEVQEKIKKQMDNPVPFSEFFEDLMSDYQIKGSLSLTGELLMDQFSEEYGDTILEDVRKYYSQVVPDASVLDGAATVEDLRDLITQMDLPIVDDSDNTDDDTGDNTDDDTGDNTDDDTGDNTDDNTGDNTDDNTDDNTEDNNNVLDIEVLTAIEAARAKIQTADISDLEGEYKVQAESLVSNSIEDLEKCTSVAEVNALITAFESTLSELKEKSEVESQRAIALDELKIFYESLNITDNSSKEMAKEVYNEAVSSIEKDSGNWINYYLDEAKTELQNIADGKMIDTVKTQVRDEIDKAADKVDGDTSIIYNLVVTKLDAADSMDEVNSVKKTALSIFENLKKGDAESAANVIYTLKSYSSNPEDMDLLSYMSNVAAKSTSPMDVIDEALDAIMCKTNDEYAKLLASRLNGHPASEMAGMSRKEMYAFYEKALQEDDSKNEELKKEKEKAEKSLDLLLSGITDTSLKKTVTTIITQAKKDLKSATTLDDIRSIVGKATEEVAAAKKESAAAKAFETKKTNLKKQIDNLISGVTDFDLKEILKKITDAAKEEIDGCTTDAQLNDILTTVKTDIKTATTEYAKDKTLATKKSDLVSKLSDLASGKTLDVECMSIISTGKTEIMNAASVEEATSAYNDAVTSFKTAYLNSMKTEYSNKLDGLSTNYSVNDDTTRAKIDNVIQQAKANVDKATSESVMENIYSQAEQSVKLLASTTNDLETIKSNAIQELNNYTTLNTSGTQKVIAAYTNKIQNATSETQVESYLSEAKALLDKLNSAAGITTNENSNTYTDAGTKSDEVGSASKKGDDVVQSAVKTGDENMAGIIASVAAIAAGLGAVIFLAIKKLKK